MLKFHN